MKKRYWLFGGYGFYPRGGMRDFIESYETLEEAKSAGAAYLDKNGDDYWYDIYDFQESKIVAQYPN